MIKKGDAIQTIQWPHQDKRWHVIIILWPRSPTPVAACKDDSGMHVNLILDKCFKPTGKYKIDLIQQIKLGCRRAVKEYVKVYKIAPPKFKSDV